MRVERFVALMPLIGVSQIALTDLFAALFEDHQEGNVDEPAVRLKFDNDTIFV